MGALERLTLRRVVIAQIPVRELALDLDERMQIGHRVLRHKTYLTAEKAAALRLRHGEDILSEDAQAARRGAQVGRKELQDRFRRDRLAGTGFAGNAEALLRPEREADVAHEHVARRGAHCQPLNVENSVLFHRELLFTNRSLSPSPRRLKPRTVMSSTTPGATAMYG